MQTETPVRLPGDEGTEDEPTPVRLSGDEGTEDEQFRLYRAEDPLWWSDAALCRGGGPNLWFSGDLPDRARAKRVCAVCPVHDACAEYAIRHESFGVWGGMTERDRARERKRRVLKLHHPSPHATTCRGTR